MPFVINEEKVERMLVDGVRRATEDMLKDRYGTGAALRRAVERAAQESEDKIVEAIKEGISRACVSHGFLQALENEIAQSMVNAYRGAFEGVVRAAAKQTANTEVVARRVVELVQQAATVAKNSD